MDYRALIPSPDAIPALWMWFQILLIITFAVHLIFMNAMLGSSIIALAELLHRKIPRRVDAQNGATVVPGLIAFTVNSGVAPLLFLHVLYGQFIFTSSVLMAWWWLAVVGLLLLAYAGAYLVDYRFDAMGRWRPLVQSMIVLTLLTVAFIFSGNTTLMATPHRWPTFLTDFRGTRLPLDDPMLLPRYLHFVLASVAIGGLTLAWIWRRRGKRGDPEAPMGRHRAMGWYNAATALQFVIGAAFLFSLPPAVRASLIGGSPMGTALFLFSLVLAVAALYLGVRRRLVGCTAATMITVLFMVLVRDHVRQTMLAPVFSPGDLPVAPETGPLVIFLIVLVLTALAIGFILRLAFKSGKAVRS